MECHPWTPGATGLRDFVLFLVCGLGGCGFGAQKALETGNWRHSLVTISNRFLIIQSRHKIAAKGAKGAEVG